MEDRTQIVVPRSKRHEMLQEVYAGMEIYGGGVEGRSLPSDGHKHKPKLTLG